MTDTNRIVLTGKVELLDDLMLYRKVKGNIQGIKNNDTVELSVDLTSENVRALYQVEAIEYKKDNSFEAQLLFLRLID